MPPTPTRITFAESKDRRPLPKPAFHDPKHHIRIYQADCLEIMAALPADCVDLIFADPPYFLSNGGITCQNGRMVSVNKGAWDRSRGTLRVTLSVWFRVSALGGELQIPGIPSACRQKK